MKIHCRQSYIHHGLIGDGYKLPSCKCKFYISYGDDVGHKKLKGDRVSYPIIYPGRVLDTLSLERNKPTNIRIVSKVSGL